MASNATFSTLNNLTPQRQGHFNQTGAPPHGAVFGLKGTVTG